MTFTILVVVMFLISGRPVAIVAINAPCDDTGARELARQTQSKISGEFQDMILWECLDATSPGPQSPVPQRGANGEGK